MARKLHTVYTPVKKGRDQMESKVKLNRENLENDDFDHNIIYADTEFFVITESGMNFIKEKAEYFSDQFCLHNPIPVNG